MWLVVSVLTSLSVALLFAPHGAAQSPSPPKITMPPKSQKVAEDGVVSFVCKASGNPAPSFHWERKGKRINDRRTRFEIVEVPHMSVLRIKPVKAKKENNIIITCVADNSLGEAKADATLFVYKKDEGGDEFPSGYPRILLHPKLKSVEKGLSTIMQCEAAGAPPPTIMWFKDMVPVDLTDPRIQLLDNGYLQIQNSQESDEATYECVAENELGVAYSYPAMMYVKARRLGGTDRIYHRGQQQVFEQFQSRHAEDRQRM